MSWLFRPFVLVVVSAGLVLAALLVLWPRTTDNRPHAQPVAGGDQEVAWLYSATNATAWERFVTAVQKTAAWLQKDHPELALEDPDVSRAFPRETTAVPEVALSVRGGSGRLLFRWYKLTSDWKTEKWVQSLTHRQPPPLAIIGGSSSDPAIELAGCLQGEAEAGPAPLLLLTTATADEGQGRQDTAAVPLTDIYPGRTYRFCFTNQQMAESLTDFLWSQEALRPDGDPFYLACWDDDVYSKDLATRFISVLEPRLAPRAQAREVASLLAAQAGALGSGSLPIDLNLVRSRPDTLAVWYTIYYSVGTFSQPNQSEAQVAEELMERVQQDPAQRPLLVLPAGSAQPARRFLRGLMRAAPGRARRLVVVTGDGIAFSTLYRDRDVSWPIQDLPFDLVLFCHRDPVDTGAGFRAEVESQRPGVCSSAGTGTEDLLLFGDLAAVLAQAVFAPGGLPATGDELGQRLRQARWEVRAVDGRVTLGGDGPPLFDEKGNRRSGTGEHIVWLQPSARHGRLEPWATITVWSRSGREDGIEPWLPSREPMRVEYEGARLPGRTP